MSINVTMMNRTKNGEDLFINYDDVPQIIVITCILSLFSVAGTTGNAFVLYVFSRKKDKNTSTIFILALAIIDFLTCLFVIPFTIYVEFMHKKVNNDVVCKIYQFLITSNVPFSAFIMVAIAFDRYFCICRPWMKCLDVKRAKRIIFSLFLFAVSLGLITCLAYGVYQQVDRDSAMSTGVESDDRIANQSFSNMNDTIYDKLGNVQNETSYVQRRGQRVQNSYSSEVSMERRKTTKVFEFTGFCYPNEVILSSKIRKIYHKFYVSLFLISFIIVFILYGLIYKSLLSRRSKRLRTSAAFRNHSSRRSTLLSSVFTRHSYCPEKSSVVPENLNNQVSDKQSEDTKPSNTHLKITDNLAVPNGTDDERTVTSVIGNCMDENSTIENNTGNSTPDLNHKNCSTFKEVRHLNHKNYTRKNKITNARFKDTNKEYKVNKGSENNENNAQQTVTISIYRKDTRKSVREKHMLANIKTAGILFIVTIVFMLAFLPSWLMATKIIPVNMIVFYMYFSYNVANPVIYAFFNHTFQKEVRNMLKCVP